MARVSVIVPAFNAARFIGDCLSSLTRQSFTDFEVLVCDDGSTDETVSIVEGFCNADSRIQLVSLEHMGAGAARNQGMKSAQGDYYYFLDADDYIDDSFLERVVLAADNYQSDIVVVKSHYLDDVTKAEWPIAYAIQDVPFDTLMIDESLPTNPFQSFVGWPWDKLFRASFVRDNGLKFQELRSTNDARFVFLSICLARRIVCLDYDGVAHRTNNKDSLEHTRSKSWNNAISAMESISDYMQSEKYSNEQRNSFANWAAHFSYWSMSTLDNGGLTEDVVIAFDNFLSSVNFNDVIFKSDEDREFASLAHSSRLGVIQSYIMQRSRFQAVLDKLYREESELCSNLNKMKDHIADLEAVNLEQTQQLELYRQYEDLFHCVKKSYSFRIGNFLLKPFSFIKSKLKSNSQTNR